MAATTVDTLIVKIEADLSNLRRQLAVSQRATAQAGTRMSRSLSTVGGVVGGLTAKFKGLHLVIGAVAGAAIVALGVDVARTAAQFQDLEMTLGTVFGGMEQGEAAMSFIQTFAQRTPFDIQTLSKAFIQLGGAGIAPTEKLLTTFGDAAAATTNRVAAFEAMVRIATRAVGGGLGLEELEQLQTQGIPVYTILQEEIGKTRMELSELGQTAEGAQQIMTALQAGLDKRFGGGMDRAAANLSVSMSNLGIAMTNLKLALGEGIGGVGLTAAFTFLSDTLMQVAVILKPVVHLIGTVMAGAIFAVVAPLRLVTEAILFLGRQLVALGRFLADAFPEFEMLENAVKALEGNLDELSKTMNENLKTAEKAPEKYEDFDKAIVGLKDDVKNAKLAFLGYDEALIQALGSSGLLAQVELPETLEAGAENARIAGKAFLDQKDAIIALLNELRGFQDANDTLTDFEGVVKNLNTQINILRAGGMAGNEKASMLERIVGDSDFTTDQIEEIKKLIAAIVDFKNTQEEINQVQDAANERKQAAKDIISEMTDAETDLEEKQRLLTEAIDEFGERALPNATQALEKIKEEIRMADPMFQAVRGALMSASTDISNSFADMMMSGKINLDKLQDIFSNFTRTIISKAFELMVVNQIINSMFGLTGTSGALPTASIGGAAGGGRAHGPMLVGERGPELFVPSSTGSIKNNMDTKNLLGGSSTVVNQTLNIETGVSQTVRAEIVNLLPTIRESTISAIVDQRRRGGPVASAFGA